MSAQHKAVPSTQAPASSDTAAEPLAPEPAAAPAVILATARVNAGPPLAKMLQMAADRYGKSPVQLLTDFARLAIGPGRLSIDEYFAFRLFDDEALSGADKSQFAGLRAMRDVWMAVNWDETWDGVFADKLALEVLLRGFGLPTTRTLAVYSEQRALPAFQAMRDVEALAAFLRTGSVYPLFGKPVDSIQSLGSASFASYDSTTDEIVCTQGTRVPVEAFAGEVKACYAAGYLFQQRLSPHPRVRALIGERLSTVRVMTVLTRSGPQVIRALWKLPGATNVADNFWRPGNMIAQLDRQTGRILRVVGGIGINAREIEHHPDTGARLLGVEVPDWSKVLELALEGATVFPKVPLIGWDIGLGEHGPLIVEPNNSPDFGLAQIADRQGLLDDQMKALIADRKAARKTFKHEIRSGLKLELREERGRISKNLWA